MSMTHLDSRVPFFNDLSERWDSFENMETLPQRLSQALDQFQVAPSENVLEVGCGTGNLTLALSRRLDASGRIVAVDCSARMLERARVKVKDPRITWVLSRVQELPAGFTNFDRAILMGVWPHLETRREVLGLLMDRLKPGALLHIWHLASRDRINQIHAGAHPSVAGDHLEPATQLARLLEGAGFLVIGIQDDAAQYAVHARRP